MAEAPNTLLSNSVLTVLDLLGDGPIKGIVIQSGAFGNDPLCSTFYDDVPVRNLDGSYNYNVSGQGYAFNYTLGSSAQTGIPGFQKVENIIPLSSNTRIANPPAGAGPWKPVIVSFTSATYPDADSVKVTVQVPALFSQDTAGNTNPYTISYAVDISFNNGPWVEQETVQINGKCTSTYLQTRVYTLPKANPPTASSEWKVRVRRVSQNVLSVTTQNEIYVETIAVVSTNLYAYPNSVLVGTQINADQFTSIPARSYLIDGLLVNAPVGYISSQYPPYHITLTRVCDITSGNKHVGFTTQNASQYVGIQTGALVQGPGIAAGTTLTSLNDYNGSDPSFFFDVSQDPIASYNGSGLTFTTSADSGILPAVYPTVWLGDYQSGVWTNNPAWIFNDLLTNPIHGLGDYIQSGAIDKWTLYSIAQYCDQMVDDGNGGLEPNFTCNVSIQQPDDAYTVLLNLASTFRGMLYYGNGAIHATQTSNKTPIFAFTNANVVDGKFSYSDTSQNTRSTVAIVKWLDPKNMYRENVEYIEDIDGIQRYGYQEKQMTAFACTSKGQAYRLGSWTLQTERLLTETVTFQTDLEGFSVRPGDAFGIYDNFRNNRSQGGRIVGFDPTRSLITLDRNVALTSGVTYSLSAIIPKFMLNGTGELTGSNQIPFIDQSQIETFAVGTPPSLNTNQLLISGAFSTGLFVGTPWVLSASGNSTVFQSASFYTCLATAEVEPGKIEVLGLQANTGINFVISTGYTTAGYPANPGDTSSISPPRNFQVVEITGATTPDNVFYDVIRTTWVNTPSPNLSYYVGSGKTFNGAYQPFTVIGTGFDFPRSITGQYLFKVASVSLGGVQSTFITGGLLITTQNPLGTLRHLSGIQITANADPLYTTSSGATGYIGTTPQFSWDGLTDSNGYPIVDIQFISGYRLSFKSFDGLTDYVTPFTVSGSDTVNYQVPSGFIYSFAGGPQRGFVFKVDSVDIYGNVSPGASLPVNNPVMKPPFSSGFIGYQGGLIYTVTPSLQYDTSGIYLWMSQNPGFTPTYSNASYVSSNLAGSAATSYTTGSVYTWFALVDTFGRSGNTIFGPTSGNTSDIFATFQFDITNQISGAFSFLTGAITQEAIARQTGDSFQGLLVQGLSGQMTGASGVNTALTVSVQQALISSGAVLTTQINAVSSSVISLSGHTNATVGTLQSALATTGGALASWITNLGAITSGQKSSVQIGAQAFVTGSTAGTGGIAIATWGFSLDSNGHVVSMQATSSSWGAGSTTYGTIVFGNADLQSNNYGADTAGWQLTHDGNLNANKGSFRGVVAIASGSDNQTILNANGAMWGLPTGTLGYTQIQTPDAITPVPPSQSFVNGSHHAVLVLGVSIFSEGQVILNKGSNGIKQIGLDGSNGTITGAGDIWAGNFRGAGTSNSTMYATKIETNPGTAGHCYFGVAIEAGSDGNNYIKWDLNGGSNQWVRLYSALP